jgi:hypothetical protein
MMKTKITLLVFVLLTLFVAPLLAQQQEEEGLFCLTIPAYKIYRHSKGYIFSYRKNSTQTGRLFFPYEWFRTAPGGTESSGKGVSVAIQTGDTMWPHVSIFYRNGEFIYVKLYIQRDVGHESWGSQSPRGNYDAEFENAEPPRLEFGE